ncbi:MAG TPA: hypothetical protein VGO21_01465, partial [Candidatus Paceibacterota bacterium]|nr:hypothetical protein [Candidatus Paceibacterota bacterium]
SHANVNYIDISKISSDDHFVFEFKYVKDNQDYYNHWTNEWNYDKPKEELVKELRNIYSSFSGISMKTTELYLFLGDISNYLYNLDDISYFESAVRNYKSAIELSPKDYRCYWFLGYHFALSNNPDSAVKNFLKAQSLLPAEYPADFWNDYAWTSGITNMPSHCIYAMNQAKRMLGTNGSFETQLGESIYKSRVEVDRDRSYKKEEIWTANQGEPITFTSRPLGIKILVDSSWELIVNDYEKRQAVFIMKPPALRGIKGNDIHYTIAIFMKAANENDKLPDYIKNLISGHTDKTRISFSNKYDKMDAYEIIDKNIYKNIGGGHTYMIGVERSMPGYPGLLLESPATFPRNDSSQVSFYQTPEYMDRFKGRIFYAILLDSCEDIHEQSLSVFKKMFEDQIIIE